MKSTRFIRSTPHLPVKDLQETFTYYLNTLGFTGKWTFGDKDGGVNKDDLRLLFAEDPDFTSAINSDHRLPLVWFVENIEGVYEEYKNRGIAFADELKRQPYGLKEFAFVDINGYYIRVAEGINA